MRLKIFLPLLLMALLAQFVDLECALGDCHHDVTVRGCVAATKILPAPAELPPMALVVPFVPADRPKTIPAPSVEVQAHLPVPPLLGPPGPPRAPPQA